MPLILKPTAYTLQHYIVIRSHILMDLHQWISFTHISCLSVLLWNVNMTSGINKVLFYCTLALSGKYHPSNVWILGVFAWTDHRTKQEIIVVDCVGGLLFPETVFTFNTTLAGSSLGDLLWYLQDNDQIYWHIKHHKYQIIATLIQKYPSCLQLNSGFKKHRIPGDQRKKKAWWEEEGKLQL